MLVVEIMKKKHHQLSMDWFKGKSTPETHGVFTIKLVGLSGSNFPIIQFYETNIEIGGYH